MSASEIAGNLIVLLVEKCRELKMFNSCLSAVRESSIVHPLNSLVLTVYTSNTWAILKVMRFDKNFVLPTISLNKILAPDVFDYGDSKSESWYRAKKIREVFMVNKSSRALLTVMENRVCFGRLFKTIIKIT